MADRMTPADSVLVMLTPNNIQIENMKLPRKDSKNIKPQVRRSRGASSAGFFSQASMAMAAIPKRNQANKNTGRMATSGLDRAT